MPGCHGTDQWTLDPPGQPRDKKISGINIPVPKGRVFGGAELRVGSVEVESAGWGGVVSHGKQAKPISALREVLRSRRRWIHLQGATRFLKMGAEPRDGGWGFRGWGVIRA